MRSAVFAFELKHTPLPTTSLAYTDAGRALGTGRFTTATASNAARATAPMSLPQCRTLPPTRPSTCSSARLTSLLPTVRLGACCSRGPGAETL